MKRRNARRFSGQKGSGFTFVEVVLAIGILAVGILALVSVYAQGMAVMSISPWELIAKEKAAEAVESVFAARDTRVLTWALIRNVQGGSGADGGVFIDGPQQLCGAGADGVIDTADDTNPCVLEAVVNPGPDGLLGTADDVQIPLQNFTREIQIRDVPGNINLRQLRVIVVYGEGKLRRQYVLTTLISSFS